MDNTKQCWSCGKETVKPKGNYYQCSECGATWNEMPELESFIDIERHYDGAGGALAYRPVKRRGKCLSKVKR